jgi:hypothetical protein
MTPYQFKNGDPDRGIYGFPYWSGRNIAKVRDQVSCRNFIFYEIDYSMTNRGVQYTVNVPGIWKLLNRIYKKGKPDVVAHLNVLYRSIEDFDLMRYPTIDVILTPQLEKGLMRVEDAIKKGIQVSRDGQSRRRQRRGQKDLKPVLIRKTMVEYCEEFGVKYYDVGFTGKEYGSAKNWLNYCKSVGLDPRTVLFEVCKFWRSFSKGAMVDDKGKQIVLPDTVSFWKYYQYRREIGSWIEVNRDRKVESKSKWAKAGEEFEKRKLQKKKGTKG